MPGQNKALQSEGLNVASPDDTGGRQIESAIGGQLCDGGLLLGREGVFGHHALCTAGITP